MASRSVTLLPVLTVAVARGNLTSIQATAMVPLLDDIGDEFLTAVLNGATGKPYCKQLVEDLAKDELLTFGGGKRSSITETLQAIVGHTIAGRWLEQLQLATSFYHQNTRASSSEHESTSVNQDPYAVVCWQDHRFISPDEIAKICLAVERTSKNSVRFVPKHSIFARMRSSVRATDRVAHLEALIRYRSSRGTAHWLAQILDETLLEWRDASPSVARWCSECLLRVVVDYFSEFATLGYGFRKHFPNILAHTGADNAAICATLIEGTSAHIDAFDTARICDLVALIGRYCTPSDAGAVAARYSARLAERIPSPHRGIVDLTDIPIAVPAALARFLYGLLGDVDSRIRWASAHTIRRLARSGDEAILSNLLGLFESTQERSFRSPEAPFYWLSARLWLVVAISGVANESPRMVVPHVTQLLNIANDPNFPHVLLRKFAKMAVESLIMSNNIVLNQTQQELFAGINLSSLPRRKNTVQSALNRSIGADTVEGKTFSFDSMDTLPYWYQPAAELFADVSLDDFLRVAETYIVERWGITNNVWTWTSEPRLNRFDERSHSLMDHRHGSIPTIERFSTHLEWHAMWCTVGELLRTQSLKQNREAYNSFEAWLSRGGLTSPFYWLADLRGPVPLESSLLLRPMGDANRWIDVVDSSEFWAEVEAQGQHIVIGAYHETWGSGFRCTVSLNSALVYPKTAAALARALQSIDNPFDYRIPTESDHKQFDEPPFAFEGWLADDSRDTGLDETDQARNGVRAVQCKPGKKALDVLGLQFVPGNPSHWRNSTGAVVCEYLAWANGTEGLNRYEEHATSAGYRLNVTKGSLVKFLNHVKMDLLIEVQIKRRNKNYGDYRRPDEEEAENCFDKIFVLRQGGEVEDADGRFGTWTASGR